MGAVVSIAIQVDGQLVDNMLVNHDLSEEQAVEASLSRTTVLSKLDDREVVRSVFVPNRLVNLRTT